MVEKPCHRIGTVTYLLSDVDNDTKTLLTESHVECMSHVDLWPHLIQKMNVFAICTTTDPKEMLYFGKNKTLWNTFLSMASKFQLQDIDMDNEDENKEEREALEAVVEDIRQAGHKYVIDAIGYEGIMLFGSYVIVEKRIEDMKRNVCGDQQNIEEDVILCEYFGKTFKMAERERRQH
eukprot:3207_1